MFAFPNAASAPRDARRIIREVLMISRGTEAAGGNCHSAVSLPSSHPRSQTARGGSWASCSSSRRGRAVTARDSPISVLFSPNPAFYSSAARPRCAQLCLCPAQGGCSRRSCCSCPPQNHLSSWHQQNKNPSRLCSPRDKETTPIFWEFSPSN